MPDAADPAPARFLPPGAAGIDELTPEQARAARRASALPRVDDGLAAIEDTTVPGPAGDLPVRIYRPEGAGPLPVIVYFYGGGWVVGSIETHDATTSALAARSGCVVISVEYRLAPEHPFPAGLLDCHSAASWIAAHGDSLGVDGHRLAVGGDSSGGNTAAAVCLLARELSDPAIAFQLLVYPATDHFGDWPSYRLFGDGRKGLGLDLLSWFSRQYLPDPSAAGDWRASPIRAADLSGLPPALIITAEYDLLRDEGEAYGHRLDEAGVAVVVHRYNAVPHGFFAIGDTPDRLAALDEAGAALRAALKP
jgi:acetyl esterase